MQTVNKVGIALLVAEGVVICGIAIVWTYILLQVCRGRVCGMGV